MTLLSRIIRWLFGIGCLGTGISLVADAVNWRPPVEDELAPIQGFEIGDLLLGMGLIVLGTVAIAPDLVRLAASPFNALVDAVFLPGGHADRPVLNLKLPAYYLREERFEEALEEYRKLIRYHPGEVEGWIGAIDLLATTFDEPRKAHRLYRKARRRFRNDAAALGALEAAWLRIGSAKLPPASRP